MNTPRRQRIKLPIKLKVADGRIARGGVSFDRAISYAAEKA
jgi:hypothetical protein